ncbi:hypothetical protein Zmor_000966 [Zophobas morio]|uniref:Nuclease HARBI1 n=1 Tax=Zophobas morio TaxID=2755281 RepID=A0AA38IY67_9CUCU|nr:hypothetical protein Zmor_000966 [Zophobas morio]
MLLITLRFFATGSFLIVIGDFGGVHKSTVGKAINRVTRAIANLREEYIKFPQTEEEISIVQQGFYQLARFPRVVGALDCTHIKIKSPGGENAEIYRNRKNFFSLNVQTIAFLI